MSTPTTQIDVAAGQAAMPTTPFASYDHLHDFPAAESEESFIMVSPSKEKEGSGGGGFHAANAAATVEQRPQLFYAPTQVIEDVTSQKFLETVSHKIGKSDLQLAGYGSIANSDAIKEFLALVATKTNTHCPTVLFAEGPAVHGDALVQVVESGRFDTSESIRVSTSPHAAGGGLMRSRCHIVVCVGLVGLDDSSIHRGQQGGLIFTKSEMVLPLWLVECRPVKGGAECANISSNISSTPQQYFYTPDMVKRISKIPNVSVLPASVCAGGVRRKGGK